MGLDFFDLNTNLLHDLSQGTNRLFLRTQNLGRVAVDIATLKESMNVDLKVLSRRVKNALDERLGKLKQKLESKGNYTLDHLNCRVIPNLESRQSMLLPPKYPVRSLRFKGEG